MRLPDFAVVFSLSGLLLVPAVCAQDLGARRSADVRLASAPLAGPNAQSNAKPRTVKRKAARKAEQATPASRKPAQAADATPVRTTLEERIAASQAVPHSDHEADALPLVKLVPPAPLRGTLGMTQAAARYVDGLVEEDRGDEKGAHLAFLEAAESGYGPAQKKLGQLYGKGNSTVRRDYAESLRWYQRAREQGENVPQPYAARNATTVR